MSTQPAARPLSPEYAAWLDWELGKLAMSDLGLRNLTYAAGDGGVVVTAGPKNAPCVLLCAATGKELSAFAAGFLAYKRGKGRRA